MAPAFTEFNRRLRWADADAAGRLHFPRIFEIIEEAESELLRGIEWPMDLRRENYDFPRVHVECQHFRPRARRLAELIALALQDSLQVRHSPPEVADAFCASRLAGDAVSSSGRSPQTQISIS